MQKAQDAQLIARIAVQDQAALRGLYARHQARVFRFLLRLVRQEAIAEELTNEVFMEAWRHAASFEGKSSAATWLLSIAHHRAVSVLRRRREESWNEEEAAEIADAEDDPEVQLQKTDKASLLRRCLEALSPEHREVIDLVYYHEMSIGEVSSIVGIPESTVKTRMFYARKRMSELLKTAGVDRGWP
ncbi:MAG TPA: sigma-70 family RNA polymerase sigma factor [Hyphomicrobiaceae bacterium]|jgi:RNA polymerase sigma-70 factor (ECF subfamily)|nr:sigma-70 family RNA polymerase sigma factor [Hyphomicrobiaceae bacterium]